MKVKYCQVTATKPNYVTKIYRLDGTALRKETSANVWEGQFRIREFGSAAEFGKLLKALAHAQCHIYGIPPNDADLITEQKWLELGRPNDQLPRTLEVFNWPPGPGVMLLDKDAPKDGSPTISKKQLFKLLLQACPAVDEVDLVYWPSASSHIFHGEVDMTGLRGQHVYLFVKDASDIERAGKALNERLWAMGHGSYEISAAGALLKRSVFDESVWQANHIDFAAGAKCHGDLRQMRGEPLVRGSTEIFFLDTTVAIPDLTPEEKKRAAENQEACRSALVKAANDTRDSWEKDRIATLQSRDVTLTTQQARMVVKRAIEKRELSGEFQITVITQDRDEKIITVKEALQSPHEYDGLLTLDPLEPDYDGRRPVGKLFLGGNSRNLFSFAHGGTNFKLKDGVKKIQLVQGKTHQAIDELLSVLRDSTDVFDFGNQLVQIGENGAMLTLTEHSLKFVVGSMVQFWNSKSLGNAGQTEVLRDPPSNVCKPILDLKEGRKLKKLQAVITAPTLRPDGSLLLAAGFDQVTGLFYQRGHRSVVVERHPSMEDAMKALDVLWKPFEAFPFCSGVDRAVHLAALLTAAVRAVLPTSPGFAYDAPVQGSGKTLLARCIGVLTQGSEPSVWPHTSGTSDEEVRKRIFTVLCSGARVLIWDNVLGVFDSAAIASCLTSPTYTDRILGKSNSDTVPNRTMLLLTGNNIQFQGELPRRILVSRIDPETDKPFAREFSLDPFTFCQANRQEMIAAALTLIRAFLTHGCRRQIKGRLASFEDWDQWVRRTVIFADELRPATFGDVIEAVTANQAADPEREALLNILIAWYAVFGSSPVHAADVVAKAYALEAAWDSPEKALKEALAELPFREPQKINSKSLGRYLGFRKDRHVGGYCLRSGPKVQDKQTWSVNRVRAGDEGDGI
jgi:hypothetical protein